MKFVVSVSDKSKQWNMKVLLVSASPRLGGNGEVKGNGFNGE